MRRLKTNARKNTLNFVIMENNKDHKNIFKEWLEKLQQESWQLELLISGFAIVGIFAARTTIKTSRYLKSCTSLWDR